MSTGPKGAYRVDRKGADPVVRRVRRPVLTTALGVMVAVVLLLVGQVAVREQDLSEPLVSQCAGRESPTVDAADVHVVPQPGMPIWRDEFDGPAGSAVDPSRWHAETGGLGWGVGELQAYTDRTANAALDGDGGMVITARREPGAGGARYTSARLSTCGSLEFNHGRVEARIRMTSGQGLWPAFWLLGARTPWPEHGEIDIMEAVNDMTRVDFTTHQPYDDGTNWQRSISSPAHPSGSWAGGFHVFAVDWTADAIVWSVDGVEYATTTRADTPPDGRWVVDRSPQVVVLNLAVGGDYPGPPDAETPFPAEMTVDYVRVYANDDTRVSYRNR